MTEEEIRNQILELESQLVKIEETEEEISDEEKILGDIMLSDDKEISERRVYFDFDTTTGQRYKCGTQNNCLSSNFISNITFSSQLLNRRLLRVFFHNIKKRGNEVIAYPVIEEKIFIFDYNWNKI